MKYNLTLARPNTDETVVQLIAYINKQRLKVGLGVTVPTRVWDKDNQRIKTGTSKDLIALQTELDNSVQAIINLHNQLVVNDGVELSIEAMKEGMKRLKDGKVGASAKQRSFDQWVDEFMMELEQGKRFGANGKALSDGTKKRYRVIHALLNDFKRENRSNRRIEFADVNVQFINDWKRWRADGVKVGRKVIRKPVNVNTLSNDLKILKVWLKQSHLDGLHDNRIWQRVEMKKTVVTPDRPRLSIEELKTVESANFESLRKGPQGPKSSAHEAVCDMFVLACWTAARYSDVSRFPELIKEGWKQNGNKCPETVEIIQAKTNTYAGIPITAPAKRIIEKYNGDLPKLPSGQKTNRILKEVIKAAGITRSYQKVDTSIDGGTVKNVKVYDEISFHDARRTCLTNFYKLRVLPVSDLMLISGHSTEAQFYQYIKIDREERLKEISSIMRDRLKDF